MTNIISRPTLYQSVIGDLLDLVREQPHQVLISTASVALVASEASLLIPSPFHILMAIGAEWAYLRGIASSGTGSPRWTAALNWGALMLVVLYGTLWGARKFGGLPDDLSGTGAWLLTLVHIVPIAFLSFAAAMVHRSAVQHDTAKRRQQETEAEARARRLQADEDERQRERQAQMDAIDLQRAAKLADVEAMEAASVARMRVRQAFGANSPQPALTASGTPTNSPANTERTALREQVAAALRDDPHTNKTALAKRLGIGRTLLYELIKEVKEQHTDEQ
jgi:hypothetical protein